MSKLLIFMVMLKLTNLSHKISFWKQKFKKVSATQSNSKMMDNRKRSKVLLKTRLVY